MWHVTTLKRYPFANTAKQFSNCFTKRFYRRCAQKDYEWYCFIAHGCADMFDNNMSNYVLAWSGCFNDHNDYILHLLYLNARVQPIIIQYLLLISRHRQHRLVGSWTDLNTRLKLKPSRYSNISFSLNTDKSFNKFH